MGKHNIYIWRFLCLFLFSLIVLCNTLNAQINTSTDPIGNLWRIGEDTLSIVAEEPTIHIEPVIETNVDVHVNTINRIATSNSFEATHTHVPMSVNPDITKVVGDIPFTSGLSPTGGIVYSVPISIVPGRNKFQPEIALTYNSQRGDGTLGYGWEIEGLSVISRVHKNLYYDNKVEAMSSSLQDVFVIDGMRLLPISGSYIDFCSEQGNLRVTAKIIGGERISFTVEYPNGNKGTFNQLGDFVYPLTTLEDAWGNKIDFEYELNNNRAYIKKISYGGHRVVASHWGYIEFSYTYHHNGVPVYEKGKRIGLSYLLSEIKCYSGGEQYGHKELVHSYSLEYENDPNASLLCKIGCDDLNPLQFYYGYSNNQYENLGVENTLLMRYFDGSIPIRVSKGKIKSGSDDDGLIVIPKKNPAAGYCQKNNCYYYSEYHPEQSLLIYPSLSEDFVTPSVLYAEDGFQTLFFADVDGIAGEEIIKINEVYTSGTDRLAIKSYKFGNDNSLLINNVWNLDTTPVLSSFWPKSFFPGDYDGDGKSEILVISISNPLNESLSSECFLLDLVTKQKLFVGHVFDYGSSQTIIPMDVDGDGKTDICVVDNGETKVYSFVKSNGTFSLNLRFAIPEFKESDLNRAIFGDINGDGKCDILVPSPESYWSWDFETIQTKYYKTCLWCKYEYPNYDECPHCHKYIGYSNKCVLCDKPLIRGLECPEHGFEQTMRVRRHYDGGEIWTHYYSTGTGLEKGGCHIKSHERMESSFMLQDVNGDGLADLIEAQDSVVNVILNTSGTFGYNTKNWYSIPMDGKQELLSSSIASPEYYNFMLGIKGAVISKLYFTKNESLQRLLTGMVSSLGVIQRNYYQRLNGSEIAEGPHVFFTSGSSAIFPYQNFIGPLWASSAQEEILKGNQLSFLAYSYKNALLHQQGLGFRGFEEICTYDMLRNKECIRKFDPIQFGVLKKEITPVSEITYDYDISVASNKKATVRLTRMEAKDLLRDTRKIQNYAYDAYDNLLSEATTYQDNSTNNIVKTVMSQTYSNTVSSTQYRIGFPLIKTVTEWRDGASWQNEEIYTYKTGQILPEKKITKTNGNKTGEIRWNYSMTGNLLSEGKAPYAATEFLTTSYSYPVPNEEVDIFRYPITKTDERGRVTSYLSYDRFGNLLSVKDPLQNTTTYTSDVLGRLSSVTYPDGVVENVTYSWTQGVGLYAITKNVTGKSVEKNYYDALKREVRKGTTRSDGQWQYIDKKYDTFGRLKNTSLPFLMGVEPLWNTYSYDEYDRTIELVEASGKTSTNNYQENVITTTIAGITSTSIYDKSGQLISIVDPGGTITYTYRPDKQIAKIVAPENVETSFGYDIYGNRNKIVDPSAGTLIYNESYSGNICTRQQTNANGKTITSVFDKYGRIVSKTHPEFETIYTYDSVTGNPEKEISTNGTSTEYVYDEYGRIHTEKNIAPDNVWLSRTFTYDSGNVSKIAYTSSKENEIGEESRIYANGYWTETLWGGTSIWRLTNLDNRGQTVGAKTGVLTRTYAYDNYGYPTERKVGDLQHFTYTFIPQAGNLLSRKDQTRNIVESFSYDNLNRLTNYAGKSVTYAANGNIQVMEGIGNLDYTDRNKPYAITGLSALGNQVPIRTQHVAYTSFSRPDTIVENGNVAAFVYDVSGERRKMEMKANGTSQFTRYYLANCYETEALETRLYLSGDVYSAPVVYLKKNNIWGLYYICRDYLGSITHITDSNGTLVQELSYDSWGRLRNPVNQSLYTPGNEPTLFLGRGYTGHEHLTAFGLINMNARLYDPALGRFLSPDPYVQVPGNLQNFNRYSYCLNNPLIYTDENGEFIIGYVCGFFKGLFKGENPWKSGWKGGKNEMKISFGLFKGSFRQILSRFTWELPQTIAGLAWSQFSNYAGQVDKVGYWGGATVAGGRNFASGAVTLGSFIVGNHNIAADPNNSLFQHEYGHYLQSQSMGLGYLSRVGIPSIMSANGNGTHKYQPSEQDANRRAFLYFNENVEGFYQTAGEYESNRKNKIRVGWDFVKNPLDVYHSGIENRYYDYNNPDILFLINSKLKLTTKWYDYASWLIPLGGTIGVGIGNGIYYNNHKK